MASVYKTPKTHVDPATGKRVRVRDEKGKTVYQDRWRFEYIDWQGRRVTGTGTADKKETRALAVRLEAEAEAVRKGWRPPPKLADTAAARPFAEVVAEYLAWGEAGGGRRGYPWGECHARVRRLRLERWQKRLGLATLADLPGILPRVEAVLRQKRAGGAAGKTLANESEALGSFCRWAINRGYLEADPLKHLGRFNVEPVYKRRAMTPEEIKRLLDAVPRERWLVYATAVTTGLRAGELRGLRAGDLNPDRPLIHVRAEIAKSRRAAMQPLPSGLWERLMDEAKGKDPDAALFDGLPRYMTTWTDRDLRAAGIPKWTPEGKVDFHATRTAFVTMVLESGADLKTAMTLARHSTPTLTVNVYGRARQERLNQTSEAVGAMVLAESKNTAGTQRKAVGAEMPFNSIGLMVPGVGIEPTRR